MTRRPHENQIRFTPVDGDEYPLNEVCAVPGCTFPSFDVHHIWRRSALGGASTYIHDEETGRVFGNVVGLCRSHHEDVTGKLGGYRAHITYDGTSFYWESTKGHKEIARLTFQPPTIGATVPLGTASEPSVLPPSSDSLDAVPSGSVTKPDGPAGDGGDVTAPAVPDICPTCKRKKPKPKDSLEPKRKRTQFNISVPKDAQEDGYEVLTDLVEQARELLGRPDGTPPYYTFVESLYGFITAEKKAA